MFQAHFSWNKIGDSALKMFLHESFKIDILGTSQKCRPMVVFSRRFEDVRRMFLENSKNKQQHILWLGSKIIQQ